MAFETGFYSTLQGPDILGNVQRGLDTRSKLDEQTRLKKAASDQAAYEEAMKANTVTNPDGTVSVNQQGFMKSLTDLGQGTRAIEYADQRTAADLNQQKLNWEKGAEGRYQSDLAMKEKELMQRDRQLREQANERRFLANQNYELKVQELGAKQQAAAAKADEMKPAQAKQAGLYRQGAEAENQYRTALTKKDSGFNPTSYGNFIDNNDWAPKFLKSAEAIEAQSAEDRWIEAYLRDASGAAIPPSERGAYAKDFFPKVGDTAQAVRDKERARIEKMEAARAGAGNIAPAELIAGANDNDAAAKALAELQRRQNAKQTVRR